MKKLMLSVVALGFALATTSCKKETTETTITTGTDTTTVVHETVTFDENVQAEINEAEIRYNKAEADLKAAVDRGDKKAEEAARKVRDEAKSSWENLKNATNKAAEDIKQGAENVANDVENAAQKVGDKAENAAQKVGDKAEKAGQDIKEGYNNTLEKMKTK